MRIFKTFPEAFEEIKRDLAEMGVRVHTRTMQNKFIADNDDFATLELQNYIYTVTSPRFEDLNPSQPWADAEWEERLAGIRGQWCNPGEAYKLRPEVWNQFLNPNGEFDYTYSRRFSLCDQVRNVIDALRRDPMSRQGYIAMWRHVDSKVLGTERVPCSLGWLLQQRDGELHMTYFMRSCDYVTHFHNDIYLALKLQEYVAKEVGVPRGRFTQYMGSLHVYQKDVKDAF